MKAYLTSITNGTILIGNTLYCLPLRTQCPGKREGLRRYPWVAVKENSWASAWKAKEKLIEKYKCILGRKFKLSDLWREK